MATVSGWWQARPTLCIRGLMWCFVRSSEVMAAYGRFLRDVWQQPYPTTWAEQVQLWFLFWKQYPPPWR